MLRHQHPPGVTRDLSTRAVPVHPARCLLVWLCVSLVLLSATLLGLDAARTGLIGQAPPDSFDRVVVTLCGAAAVLICPWLWLVSTLAVAEALRGRVRPGAGWVRRLTLTACGCAITLTAIAPAHATVATSPPDTGGATGSVAVLSGLPFPERPSSDRPPASGPPRSEVSTDAAPGRSQMNRGVDRHRLHVVERGDTLWAIAGDALRAASPATSPTAADTARAVSDLHERNRDVLGHDADLIHPGQQIDTTLDGEPER